MGERHMIEEVNKEELHRPSLKEETQHFVLHVK
jgi:hypothetical protein